MTKYEQLIMKIQQAKMEAQSIGVWATFRALDAAEKAYGEDMKEIIHPTFDEFGRVVGTTTSCEYCLGVGCDQAPRYAPMMCELKLIQIRIKRASRVRLAEYTRKQWVCESCREYLRKNGAFRVVKL